MITSSSNNRIKQLIQLNKKAKVRKEQNVFLVEGSKMFLEAPKDWVREIYVSESFSHKEESKAILKEFSYEVVADDIFQKITDTVTPQGILCVVQRKQNTLQELLEEQNGLYVVLEDIQDPGNLGTIIRTAEGAGVSAVFMTRETVDLYNPKTIRATMGSIYRMPCVIVDDIQQLLEEMQKREIRTYAAHLLGEKYYDEEDYKVSTAFVIGNEGNGLKEMTANSCSCYVKIPMEGQVESLNAAIATSLFMYEANRQRR